MHHLDFDYNRSFSNQPLKSKFDDQTAVECGIECSDSTLLNHGSLNELREHRHPLL